MIDSLLQEGRAEEIHGIADRNPQLQGSTIGGRPVLGSLEQLIDANSHTQYAFCICLSEDYFADRAQITAELVARGQKFASIFSVRSHISPTATIAPGVILYPGACVGTAARVGSCVSALTDVLIEHDCVVHDNVELAPRALLAGASEVETGAFVGLNATVFPKIVVGAHATVGGGAVVTRHVAAYAVVAGNPARVLRMKDP